MAKKITKKKEQVTEHSFLLKGDHALLLAEGCKLNKQKKEIEKRLDEIKKELDLKVAGDYKNSAGDEVNFSKVPKMTDPDPKEVHNLLKAKKLTKFFWSCVKVQLTNVKKYISEKELNDLRTNLDPTPKYTFK